jgi:hypothetical protein
MGMGPLNPGCTCCDPEDPVTCEELAGYTAAFAEALVDIETEFTSTDHACCDTLGVSIAGATMLFVGSGPNYGLVEIGPTLFCSGSGLGGDPYHMYVTAFINCLDDLIDLTIAIDVFSEDELTDWGDIQWTLAGIADFQWGVEYELPFSFETLTASGFPCMTGDTIGSAFITIYQPA